MLCCDSSPATANLTCTLEYYSQTELYPNFDYMLAARPVCIVMTVFNAYLFFATATHVLRKSNRGRLPWAVRTIPLSHLISLLYTIRSLVDLYSNDIGVAGCDAIQWMGCTLYGISTSHVYTILWFRQRTLYADPLLKHTVTKAGRTLSKVTIVAIYVLLWSISIAFQFSYCTVSSPFGCIVVWDVIDSNIFVLVVVSVFAVTSTVFHTLLLCLIAYPLMHDGQTVMSTLGKLCSPASNDVERMLKRLFFCASLCIVSTQVMSLTMMLDAMHVIQMYYVLSVQVDLIVSNVSAVCAFSDWKQWLFPFVRKRPS